MNTINKKFMSLFMGLIVLGSFNAVNASESTREVFKARLENAAQSLVAQYGRYVPAMPTMPSLPSALDVKESVKQVSTKILANGKEFFSLQQPLSSLASRTASVAIAYFMLTYWQDLCDQVPSLKRYGKITKNNLARIFSAVSAAFVADQMSAKHIKYFMGMIATFYLIVRYFGLKPVLKRLVEERQNFKHAFNHVNFSNNANIRIIQQGNESIQYLTNEIHKLVPKYNAKHDQLLSAQNEIKFLNAKIEALEKERTEETIFTKNLGDSLTALRKDLELEFVKIIQERNSLEANIQKLEKEKQLLADTLTNLNRQYTILEATTALTVEDSQASISQYATPVASPNASAQNSDQSDQEDNN